MNTPNDLLKVEADECAAMEALEDIASLFPGWEALAVHMPAEALRLLTSESLAPVTYRSTDDVGRMCDLLSGCVIRNVDATPQNETVQDVQGWMDHMVKAGQPFVVIRKLEKPNLGMIRLLKERKHFPTIGGSTWARRKRGD